MLRTGLVFGLLSHSVNKGSVLYWVFVANIVLSSILNAIKSYTIIRHKSNPPLLIQITNMFKQQNFSYNSYLSLVYKARLRDIEMSVSLIASFMNIFSSWSAQRLTSCFNDNLMFEFDPLVSLLTTDGSDGVEDNYYA